MKSQLNNEQQMIDSGEAGEHVLRKHNEFFSTYRLTSVKDCLSSLKVLSEEYISCQPSDSTLRETYLKREKEWNDMNLQIQNLVSQLKKREADWTEYCQRFNELLQWMDEIEKSIKNVTHEISSSTEFETVKTKFLDLCQNVDSKREDVKWLVRKLDSLLSHISKEDSVAEQKKLDSLLSRYKSLLPEIETTIVVTETITKCFIYREEVVEVNRWLKEVQALTDAVQETTCDDPQKLAKLIQQQEAVVKQLETHLENVKSSVQKGKDLGKQKLSPRFIEQEVHQLEQNWEEVYEKAVKKLNVLKNASSLWDDYDKQKDEIFRLLKQADEELKKLRQAVDVQPISKQCKELHETTEDHLEKFKNVSSSLAPQLSEKQRPLLEKEVIEIENRVLMVLSTLKENVEYLERTTEKWTKFNFKLESFVSHTDDIIDRLKEILSETSPPEDRLRKLDELHAEIREQKQVLLNLETESKELAQDQPESANVKKIIGQLTNLKDRLQTLEETIITQRNIISKNLEALSSLKDILRAERDELRTAELRVEAGIPTPTTLKEAKEKKADVVKFCDHCHSKISYLSDVSTQTSDTLTDAAIQTEFIEIQDQWKNIAETIQQWIEQLQVIVALWEGVTIKLEGILKWLDATETSVKNVTSIDTVNISKLEELKLKLKTLASGIDEQRGILRKANEDIDELSKHLSPKAVMALHVQTSDLQKRIDELGDTIRVQMIRLGSLVAEQEQLLKTIDSFTKWEEDVKLQLNKYDDIFVDQIEAVLKKIQILKIENDAR
ncbi:Nesprin-1, partial [Stegodyphus mimosarum]